MKRLAKSLAVLLSMMSFSSVSAFENDMNPFIGIDYYTALMKGRDDYLSIFPKSYPGVTIYIGTKFHEYFGVELGFDTSGYRKKEWVIPANSSFFNLTNGPTDIVGQTSIRRAGGHFDLFATFPIVDCFDLTGAVGFGWIKPTINMNIISGPPGGSPLEAALNSIQGKGKGFFRLGIGGSYMFTNIIGARGKVGWEGTSQLRVSGDQNFVNAGFREKAFKGSTAFSLGIFSKF